MRSVSRSPELPQKNIWHGLGFNIEWRGKMENWEDEKVRGLAILTLMISAPVFAHGGGLNAEGCHNDRKNGGYHCHRAPSRPPTPRALMSMPEAGSSFPNCTAARAAGAAPIRVGQRGYGRHLDRDGDGVGCE